MFRTKSGPLQLMILLCLRRLFMSFLRNISERSRITLISLNCFTMYLPPPSPYISPLSLPIPSSRTLLLNCYFSDGSSLHAILSSQFLSLIQYFLSFRCFKCADPFFF